MAAGRTRARAHATSQLKLDEENLLSTGGLNKIFLMIVDCTNPGLGALRRPWVAESFFASFLRRRPKPRSRPHPAALLTKHPALPPPSAPAKKPFTNKQSHLQELVADKHGSRTLLALLAPSHLARYVSPAALAMMRPPPRTQRVAAGKAGDVDGGEGKKGGGGGGGAESDEEADEEEEEEEADAGDGAAAAAAGRKQKKQAGGKGEGGDGGDAKKKEEEEEEEGGAPPVMVERPLGESKKDPEARRRELLAAGGFGAALVELLAADGAAPALLRAPGSADVVAEAARGAEGGLLWQSQRAGIEALHASIVEAAAARLPGGGEEGGQQQPQQQQQKQQKKQKQQQPRDKKKAKGEGGAKCGGGAPGCGHDHEHDEGAEEEADDSPLLSHYYASRALRCLALASREEGAGGEGARAFVARLWDGALKGRCAALAPTHAAKVLAAVASGGEARVRGEAARELEGVVAGGDVDAWAARFVVAAGGVGGGSKKANGGGGDGGKARAAGKAAAAAAASAAAAAPPNHKRKAAV